MAPSDQNPRRAGRDGDGGEERYRLDPQRLWQLLRRRAFFLLLPLLVIGAVVGLGLQNITPVYLSSSKILIEERGTGTDLDRLIVTPQMQRMRDQNRLTVVREKLRSEDLLLKVIRNLRLREDPSVLEEARRLQQEKLPEQTVTIIAERILVNRLRNKVWVRAEGSDIYITSVEDNDPNTAYRLNEAIVQAFIDQDMKDRYEQILESSNFTDEQLEQARAELQRAEDELERFKRSMLVGDELSGNPVDQGNVQSAESLLRLIRLDRAEAERELQQVRDNLGGNSALRPSILNDPEVASLTARLGALEREDYLAQLASRSGGTGTAGTGISPERQRIGVQRSRLAERVAELVSEEFGDEPPARQRQLALLHELTLVREVLSEHEEQVNREYRAFGRRVQAQPAQEAELRRLEASVERTDKFFQTLVNARLAGDTTMMAEQSGFGTRIRTIEPAKKPLYPAAPNKAKIALLAAVLALGIGLGAVFLSEYVDTSFKDVDEVRQVTGMEVLGTLPRFAPEMQWEKAKRRQSLAWRAAFAVTLIVIMALFVLFYRRSMVQDRIYLVETAQLSRPLPPGGER